MYFSMQKNRSWVKTVILDLCVIYVAFGMVRLLSVEYSLAMFIGYIAIQTAVALLLLFYFNRSDIEEYYQNMTYVK
jgi:presenilin-like A22 family membrane protease